MGNAQPSTTTSTLVITEVTQQENGLTLTWNDGSASFFHFIWLRDCCYCERCGDTYSSKRFLVPSDIPLDIAPASVAIDVDGALQLTWPPDSHASRYDAAWLHQNRYDEASRSARFQQPILWDSSLADAMPRISFAKAGDDGDGRMQLYRALRDYGFVLVTDGPREKGSIESVAGLIGDLGASAYTAIFDLSPHSKTRTMGNTTRPVPPHTDEAFRFSPPGINILGCVRPADDGGDSILVDGFKLADILKRETPHLFDMLTGYAQSYHRIHDSGRGKTIDERTRQPMIELDDRGEVIGIRVHTRSAGPLLLPADKVEDFYAAHHRLSELMMSAQNQLTFRLDAGDSVLFDNHRVLHARTDFTDPERFLQICNVPRESFHQRLRAQARSMGFIAESEMILCAGV